MNNFNYAIIIYLWCGGEHLYNFLYFTSILFNILSNSSITLVNFIIL